MQQQQKCLETMFPCWEALSDDQQSDLRRHTVERVFHKGESISPGRDCSGLILVNNGVLRAFILSESGKEVTLYRLFDWDICLFSAACIMKNIQFDIHVQAEKETLAYVIPADLYDRLMHQSLAVADYTNQLMSTRFSDVMWTLEQILFKSFDSRLAGYLQEQCAIDGTCSLSVTHDEVARHLGTAREVVTRMLKYFQSEGYVQLSRGKIEVLQPDNLQAVVG